jgi:hypothetical protein
VSTEQYRERKRRWREANREAVNANQRRTRAAKRNEDTRAAENEYRRQRRAANPESVHEADRRWKAANPEKMAEQKRQRTARLRARVFAHYGDICACCGTAESLTIDHVNGNGTGHRREVLGRPNTGGVQFYFWLIRNDFPDGFQTLCMPCNQSKSTGPRCRIDHEIVRGTTPARKDATCAE